MKNIPIKSSAQEYLSLAQDYNKQKKYVEATQASHQAIELEPNYAEAYNSLGFSYLCLGLYLEALRALNKAIELAPNYAEAYNNRCAAYCELGKWLEALQDANTAIGLKPNCAIAYDNRSTAYKKLGRWFEAFQDISEVIKLEPDNEDALRDRQICCENIIKTDQETLDQLSSRKRKGIDKNPGERDSKQVIIPQMFVQSPQPTATKLPQSPNEKPKEETVLGIKIKKEPQEETETTFKLN